MRGLLIAPSGPLVFQLAVEDRQRSGGTVLLQFDEGAHGRHRVSGWLDELHAGSVANGALVQLADLAMDDATLDDDGAAAQRQAEVVKGVELKRERGLDQR